MREYRGKRLDSGEWVEGYYKKIISDDPSNDDSLGKSVLKHYIVENCHEDYEYEHTHIVDPSTMGQYIGPKDRNEKEVAEGDIVRYLDAFMAVESGDWEEITSVGVIKWDEEQAQYYVTNRESIDTYDFWEQFDEAEIIGNIHDNPELLKVTI